MSLQNKNSELHPEMNQLRRMGAKAERDDDRGTQIGLDDGTHAPRGTRRRIGVSAGARRLVMAAACGAARAGSSQRTVAAISAAS